MTHPRSTAAALFVLAFLVVTAWLFKEALAPDRLPVGAQMPDLTFRTATGSRRLRPDERQSAIVIWFHSACAHCRSEFDMLDGALPRLGSTHVFLLTSEDSLFSGRIREPWPALAGAANVAWGIVESHAFRDAFGTSVTPAAFVFHPDGSLARKFRGEVSLEALLPSPHGLISADAH